MKLIKTFFFAASVLASCLTSAMIPNAAFFRPPVFTTIHNETNVDYTLFSWQDVKIVEIPAASSVTVDLSSQWVPIIPMRNEQKIALKIDNADKSIRLVLRLFSYPHLFQATLLDPVFKIANLPAQGTLQGAGLGLVITLKAHANENNGNNLSASTIDFFNWAYPKG